MLLQLTEGLLADDMFDAAGVLCGGMLADAKGDKVAGQQLVALESALGNGSSGIGQVQVAVVIHDDKAVLTELLHSVADARLGESQLVGDVDRANVALALSKY